MLVTKDTKERFVIKAKSQVFEAENKKSALIQAISSCKCFPLYRVIS